MSLNKTFAYHKPSPEGAKKIEELRGLFSAFLDEIKRLTPASREQSVAITNLEQTAMWAVKSIVHNDPGSVVQ